MKKIFLLTFSFMVLVLMSCAKEEVEEIVVTEEMPQIVETKIETIVEEKTIEDYVTDAILSHNKGMYLEGVCRAEAHKILGTEEKDDILKVYALTMYGEYDFKDDMFIKVSGSGTIPTVITFVKKDNEYELQNVEYPTDGGGYVESAKSLFPEKYHKDVLSISDEIQKEMTDMERKYPAEYLKKIGSNAKIGDYSDLNY